MKQHILYLMCGCPGSGKSTWAAKNVGPGDVIISRDQIRFDMLNDGEAYFCKENAVFNEVYFTKTSRTKGFLGWAFLPYNEMRGRSYCKFLNGRPYLLPVAWCWRFIYRVYTGNLVPLLKGAFGSETIKKKEGRLSEWGL